MDTFTFTTENIIRRGWGVSVTPIFQDESEAVCDIDVNVVEIAPQNVRDVGGTPCVQVGPELFVPVDNFRADVRETNSDTHDLRTRWFATEEAAREHAKTVESTWANPNPWESFVELG